MGNLNFRQVHLDFHTSEEIGGVGAKFNAKEFARTLKKADVNTINLFSKCHHGWVYYNSKQFRHHPNAKVHNLLEQQIEACNAEGIHTVIYISAGWDELMAREHSEWIERRVDGKPNGAGALDPGWRKMCFNTPYVDYFESQVIDVMKHFKGNVGGLWIDIIFQEPCFCPWCMESMKQQGLDPENEADRWTLVNQILNNFKHRIFKTIRKYDRTCSVFFNSGHIGPYIRPSLDAYTHLELESLPGNRENWGYEHFPITVRYAKNLGHEYLGMTGKFHFMWGDFGGYKNPQALDYECFTSIAHGAKVCIGDQLHPSGKINKATYDLIGSTYRKIKEREEWCEGAQAVTEIGVITPESTKGSNNYKLSDTIRGVYMMLEQAHYQFDIIDLEMDLNRYKMVILPDNIPVEEPLRRKLDAYVAKGGSLLLTNTSGMDPERTRFVLKGMGVQYVGPSKYEKEYVVKAKGQMPRLHDADYCLYEKGQYVKPLRGTKVLADLWKPYFDRTYKHFCSHGQTPVDRPAGYPEATRNGRIVYFAHPLFGMFRRYGTRVYKDMVLDAIESVLGDKLVKTNAPTSAHVVLNYQPKQKRNVLHILHYIPEARSRDVDVIEDVLPLYEVKMAVKLDRKVKKVTLQPEGAPVEFTQEGGVVSFTVPKVEGYQIVVME